ncbi:MAG: family 43 glycosylhydrolase [Oscillospiraceae bacterium]|nr:family 43 glycosylhydrolase [Oscillospiraceae bacterium]
MKKRMACTLAAIISLCAIGQTAPLTSHAENPIIQTSFTPDPAPMVYNDTLYVYTGRDRDGNNDFYYMTGYQVFSTTDMKNWTNHGCFMEDTDFSWGKKDSAWASQCIERNGKFYFYVTFENASGGGRAIGVAVADSPTGPFKDALGKPLVGPNWDYIDPTVIIDDDGQAYLMFGNPTCYYVKLKEDMITLDGPIQHFDMNPNSFGPSSKKASSYGEGPWIYKHDSLYYLVFAAFYGSDGGESMGYSTAPTVTGPWTYGGQIMKPHNCFTTHGGIIDYKGHSYFFYHKNGLKGGGTFNRSAAVEEFRFNPDGSIPLLTMSDEGPAQLEYLNPYQRVEAETGSWFSGLQVEPSGEGTQAVGYIQDGDYIKVSGVEFGEEGAKKFTTSISSDGQGGAIELHLDALNGPIIGVAEVPVTGGWKVWEEVECKVTGATGVHDLYLRFSGGNSYLFNIDWWKFEGEPEQPYLLGDVNDDGTINAADMTLAKSMILTESKDAFAGKKADVDKDGKVTEKDITWYTEFLTTQREDYPQ